MRRLMKLWISSAKLFVQVKLEMVKFFILPIEEVVRIRTGERGGDAV